MSSSKRPATQEIIDTTRDSDQEDHNSHSEAENQGHAVDKVQAQEGTSSPSPNAEVVRQALDRLRFMELLQARSNATERGKKAAGEHKFWATQPVPQLGDQPPVEDGCIEPTKATQDIRQEPYPLPKDFEWSTLDLNDPTQIKEIYDLLSLNYVEDDEASFRFKYSAEFLQWALKPPGYYPEWHIGVRVSSNKKLVAFISGVPMTLRVRKNEFLASEINYLCVHKKLRSKRLTPVLIKEVTRRVNLCGIAQAIYTVGLLLPTPVTTCRYFHRLINIPKLIDVKFTYVPRNMTLARMIRLYKLDKKIVIPGLREIEERDVPEVADIYSRYMQRFDMVHLMTVDEVRHQFLSGRGDLSQPSDNHRRPEQVVWTYVVEDPETHRITDFFSFYSLPSTVIDSPKHDVVEAAYLFYYASDAALATGANAEGKLKKRLVQLMGDALTIAGLAKFDVFNAVTLMDNVSFLEDLKFGGGDGLLNFYLYNWRTSPLAGTTAVDGVEPGRGVGVVML